MFRQLTFQMYYVYKSNFVRFMKNKVFLTTSGEDQMSKIPAMASMWGVSSSSKNIKKTSNVQWIKIEVTTHYRH